MGRVMSLLSYPASRSASFVVGNGGSAACVLSVRVRDDVSGSSYLTSTLLGWVQLSWVPELVCAGSGGGSQQPVPGLISVRVVLSSVWCNVFQTAGCSHWDMKSIY